MFNAVVAVVSVVVGVSFRLLKNEMTIILGYCVDGIEKESMVAQLNLFTTLNTKLKDRSDQK